MRNSSVVFSFAVAMVSSITITSCADSHDPTGPVASAPVSTRLLFASPVSVNVVTRDTALSAPLSVSKTVGMFGGYIALPEAGLTLIVPAFALSSPTHITVTAVAGNQVAYEFEPHGTTFAIPIIARQQLAHTSASTGGLLVPAVFAGYFSADSLLNQPGNTALVTELLNTTLGAITGTATFGISHFSGYLLATGRTDPGEDIESHQ